MLQVMLHFAGIMLYAFQCLLCQKLCRHNRRKPTLHHKLDHRTSSSSASRDIYRQMVMMHFDSSVHCGETLTSKCTFLPPPKIMRSALASSYWLADIGVRTSLFVTEFWEIIHMGMHEIIREFYVQLLLRAEHTFKNISRAVL